MRVTQGISRDELARRAGVSRGTMHYIETGVVEPKMTTLRKIANGLCVSFEYLLTGLGPVRRTNAEP